MISQQAVPLEKEPLMKNNSKRFSQKFQNYIDDKGLHPKQVNKLLENFF